jgi:alpha-1,6-mannosyltransferase
MLPVRPCTGKMNKTTILALLLIPALVLIHLFVAPYTKVEESPAIQAVHDILVYGLPVPASLSGSAVGHADRLRATYDHLTFSGAVPRSFVGPLALAAISKPLLWLGIVDFANAQTLARAVLGLANAAALVVFARSLSRTYGDDAGLWWVCLLAGQFHVFFYASRTLGNMFAFGLTTLAFSTLIPRPGSMRQTTRYDLALIFLSVSAVVFRAELALLLGVVGLAALLVSPVFRIALIVAASSVLALLVSVPIDSYFWLKPIWPELWSVYYNVVLGKASNWGTEPWYYYFLSAIPRLQLNPSATLLVPFALWRLPNVIDLYPPSFLFVLLYSLQPHKETRFIIYVVPSITAVAALGANYIFRRRAKSVPYAIASVALVVSTLVSITIGLGMLIVSSLNYPGGDALNQLSAIVARDFSMRVDPTVYIHTDVLSCMTGVTLFGQNPSGSPVALLEDHPESAMASSESLFPGGALVLFDKTEDKAVLQDPSFWYRFDYALAEDPSTVLGDWDIIGVVHGYAGVELERPGKSSAAGIGLEEGVAAGEPVLGKGVFVARLKAWVQSLTGGWWIGPRMTPQIRILRRASALREEAS